MVLFDLFSRALRQDIKNKCAALLEAVGEVPQLAEQFVQRMETDLADQKDRDRRRKERMAAEQREREAREHRSKGDEQAEVIRADADRQRTILEAEAYRDAELLRGEGDALAAAIYAEAFNKNPEFYSFVRSLNAYRDTFNNKNDVLLVDPNSDFFRYLEDRTGRVGQN